MRYLLPIAGHDEPLFPRKEFHFPKTLIEIHNRPMIELVVSNILAYDPDAEFIFIANRQDCVDFSLADTLTFATGSKCTVIQLERPTQGGLCSALMAIEHINDDKPLVICNGDQLILSDHMRAIEHFRREDAGGGLITFESVHPRWSYVRLDDAGKVVETAEKRVLSRRAIAGFYYYRTGAAFVEAAKKVILDGQSLNGTFYISPTMNQLILIGESVSHFTIPEPQYHSFYSPQRLDYYQQKYALEDFDLTAFTKCAKTNGVQVVIPMAGLGSRFSQAGYDKPKPFIDVRGQTMIERVMDNLATPLGQFILIARKAHLEAESVICASIEKAGNVRFSPIDLVTEGASCTVLTARARLNPDAPLLIANCDQIVDFDCEAYIEDAVRRDLDGSILVFRDVARDPKWSFAHLDANGYVDEVKEKVAISDIATVGLYYFRKAGDFINGAIDMIARNDRVNNEFYVCPVYNYLIRERKKIGVFFVEPDAMHGIGTPEDLNAYLNLLDTKT